MFIAKTPDLNVWHRRLGHPALSIVNQVLDLCHIKKQKQSVFQFCNSCQLGKNHRLPFALSNSRASKPFELVYTDVWGPAAMNYVTRH